MTAPQDFHERARRAAARVEERVNKALGTGLYGVRRFIEVQVREALSVTAPRKRIGGNWVATTPATPGHPPRLVTGAGRKSFTSYTVPAPHGAKYRTIRFLAGAKSKRGFYYMVHHEKTNHQFVAPTIEKNMANIKRILGDKLKFEFKK